MEPTTQLRLTQCNSHCMYMLYELDRRLDEHRLWTEKRNILRIPLCSYTRGDNIVRNLVHLLIAWWVTLFSIIAEMSTMSTCVDQFQNSLVSTPVSMLNTYTHTYTHTRTCTHTPRSLSLLPGCDPETAVCLHTSKGEWLSIGMTSTQEIIGTSKTSPTAPFPPSLHSL